MPRLPLLAVLALALTACDTDGPDLVDLRVDDLSHDAAALVGTWDLVTVTSSGFGGPPTTYPVAAGTETITFRTDGTVEIVRADGPDEITTYAVVPAGPAFPDAPPGLRIGDRSEAWGIDGDRLYFDSRSLDGDLSEYLRR